MIDWRKVSVYNIWKHKKSIDNRMEKTMGSRKIGTNAVTQESPTERGVSATES